MSLVQQQRSCANAVLVAEEKDHVYAAIRLSLCHASHGLHLVGNSDPTNQDAIGTREG